MNSDRRPIVLPASVVLLAALSVGAWFAWLGWDHTYQTDPVTGDPTGPYQAWQVIGCALTLAATALVAGVLTRPWLPVAVMPLAFTITWSVPAARTDDTGLWGVGAVMLLVGSLLGAAVIGAVAHLIRRTWGARGSLGETHAG